MNWKQSRALLATTLLVAATALAAWGVYRIVTLPESRDEASFYLSDGPPAVLWGCAFVLAAYLLRFKFRLHAAGMLAGAASSILAWGETRLGRQGFDTEFFYWVLSIGGTFLVLCAMDRPIQRLVDFLGRKLRREPAVEP